MKKILLIAGTRPNFIKLAPLYHRLKEENKFDIRICHTGQHYDFNMSDVFWKCLDLPTPDFSLNISGSFVAEIIGKTLTSIGSLFQEIKFDLVVVFGDVNATVAGAIAGAQSGVKVMHIEAGLRSYDRRMPEEVNRVLTDHISDFLMVSENSGLKNLQDEGINSDKVHFVGNIMIESLLRTKQQWKNTKLAIDVQEFITQPFAISTFHRPENVDSEETLKKVVDILLATAQKYRVILPLHPRTALRLKDYDLITELKKNKNILLTKPLPYFDFLKLVSLSDFVFTDSGGIQEETTFLNIPCITFRNNTERPITITDGTNQLLGISEKGIVQKMFDHIELQQNKTEKNIITLWDNKVSIRIVSTIKNALL